MIDSLDSLQRGSAVASPAFVLHAPPAIATSSCAARVFLQGAAAVVGDPAVVMASAVQRLTRKIEAVEADRARITAAQAAHAFLRSPRRLLPTTLITEVSCSFKMLTCRHGFCVWGWELVTHHSMVSWFC